MKDSDGALIRMLSGMFQRIIARSLGNNQWKRRPLSVGPDQEGEEEDDEEEEEEMY